jgi:thiol-disulfide isomerase/thioredoxin
MKYSKNQHRESNWAGLFAGSHRWRRLVIGVVVLSAIWIYVSRVPTGTASSTALPNPQVGFAAPDFALDTLDGQSMKLSGLRGQPVLVNLWASWCPPCRAEMPALDAVYRKYRDAGFVVVAVNTTYQDTETDARAFVQRLGLSFPILLDRDGTTSQRYKLQGLPTSYFVGRDGVIRDIVIGGPMNETTIASKVEALLNEGKR